MWRLTPGQMLQSRQFGDEVVLFNNLSGATHLLGLGALHLLGLLKRGPAAFPELNIALAAELGCERDQAFDDDAAALLEQLAALWLVEPLPC
ncbi:MAG: HPr-rel-A system PqqD family peptide chaperone [Pseudomonadota bacterium]